MYKIIDTNRECNLVRNAKRKPDYVFWSVIALLTVGFVANVLTAAFVHPAFLLALLAIGIIGGGFVDFNRDRSPMKRHWRGQALDRSHVEYPVTTTIRVLIGLAKYIYIDYKPELAQLENPELVMDNIFSYMQDAIKLDTDQAQARLELLEVKLRKIWEQCKALRTRNLEQSGQTTTDVLDSALAAGEALGVKP